MRSHVHVNETAKKQTPTIYMQCKLDEETEKYAQSQQVSCYIAASVDVYTKCSIEQ